jgi:hypothetical protein
MNTGGDGMKSLKQMVMTFGLLMLSASVSFAQETEATAEESPQGLGLLMILIGLTAIIAIGLVMARREATGDATDLV